MNHQFTREQLAFLRENAAGCGSDELTARINARFGLKLSLSQIRACKKNHGIKSGIDSRFYPGYAAHNKGKPGTAGWKSTQYKKGHRPHNYMPVGSERVNGDGYVDIKVADPNRWRAKHLLVWEANNGKVPNGQAVIFGDHNNRNFDPENLILITKSQLATMNRKGLIFDDAESTRTGAMIAKVLNTASNRLKRRQEGNAHA